MQVACVYSPPVSMPLSDVEKMKIELSIIKNFMKCVDEKKADKTTYDGLRNAIMTTCDLVYSLDNANDFYKIDGFSIILPLLNYPQALIVAAVAELVADLCQNNTYCQEKAIDFEILPKLVTLLKENKDDFVCSKTLYAISCLCRHNTKALKHLEVSNAIPALLEVLVKPNERLQTKAAFFLGHLSSHENFSEVLHNAGYTEIIIKLLEEETTILELLLGALLAQVSKNEKSLTRCKNEPHLKDVLQTKLKFYDTNEEHKELREYCQQLLDICFGEE